MKLMTGALTGFDRVRTARVWRVGRVPGMLRFLWGLAMAVATLLVCAAFGGPRTNAGAVAAAVVVEAHDSANAARHLFSPDPLRSWQGSAPRRPVDFKDVELDDDDDEDDDPLADVALVGELSFRCVHAPRRSERALRGVVQADTSSFAARPGLPRGPPV